jgi:putative phage-type endonuclease
MHEKVKLLKQIKVPEQRSPAWYDARKGAVTASDLASILPRNQALCSFYAAEFQADVKYSERASCNPYSTCRDFIIKKTEMDAEHSVRAVREEFQTSAAILHGNMFEPIATRIYSEIVGERVHEFGLIAHPSGIPLAASPDGITEDTATMLEIKCPASRRVSDVPPLWYWVQMQAQMACCGLDLCHFFDCKFVKYAFAAEWLADLAVADNPGFFGVCVADGADTEYAPESLSPEAQLAWARDRDGEVVCYRLLEYKLARVRKQPNWLELVRPHILKVWNIVTLFRVSGEAYAEFLDRKRGRKT